MNPKHISMELTADGARVTNLKMDGGKLILTIEAQLADSQLTASDVDGSVEALAASLLPSVEESPAPAPSPRPTPDTGIFTLKPATPEPAPAPTPAPAPMPVPFSLDAPPVFAETPVDPARPTRPVEQPKPISFGDPLGSPASAPAIGLGIASGIAPGIAMEQPFEPETPNPFAAPAPVFEAAAPVGGISLGSDSLLSFAPPPATAMPQAAPQPQFQQPAPAPISSPALDLANPFAQPLDMSPMPSLAVSEESNVFGGARHGEPQPAISFGQDLLGQPVAPAPAAPRQPAFAAAPGLSLGAALPPQQPAPAAPQPMLMPDFGLAPAAAPGIGFETPSPAPVPAPTPAPQPMQMAQPAFAPSPAPAPVPAPAPMPAPEEKPRPEAGGTTVLIRYTCPKCKTQGMQAVDKVGTVVNCSNCGKAMRLVMKK